MKDIVIKKYKGIYLGMSGNKVIKIGYSKRNLMKELGIKNFRRNKLGSII